MNVNNKVFSKMELFLSTEKITSKLVFLLSVIDIAAAGLFGGAYALTGIVWTAAIFLAFLALERIYMDNSRSWLFFGISMAALYKTAWIQAHIFQLSANEWIETISLFIYCFAVIMMISLVNSHLRVTNEDIERNTKRDSDICS